MKIVKIEKVKIHMFLEVYKFQWNFQEKWNLMTNESGKKPQSLALSSDNIFFEVYSWGQGVIIVY